MTEDKNYWIDENQNRWSKLFYTKEQAEKNSKTLTHCTGCTDCTDCTDCTGCTGCTNCTNFGKNPQRYVTPFIGSRNAQTTLYWGDGKQQILCGCFRGDIDNFEAKVLATHSESEHLQPYLKQIEIMKYLVGANNENNQ